MSKTNMICVGGPMHGQRKQVEPGRTWWECVERPKMRAADLIAPDPLELPYDDAMTEIAYTRHIYEREVIGAGDKSITFWRHSKMPLGQVAHYLLNDLSDNEPYTRIATLEWALKKIRDVATYSGEYKSFRTEREQSNEIYKLVNAALRPPAPS